MSAAKTATPAVLLERIDQARASVPAELSAWLAAAVAGGFELPAEVLALAEKAVELAQQGAANKPPVPPQGSAQERVLAGQTPEAALTTDVKYQAALARYEEVDRLLRTAQQNLTGQAEQVFAAHRDDLIRGPLRAAVADLLRRAAGPAKVLKDFAPDFTTSICNRGEPAHLEAWQASRALQRELETYHAAWRASWARASVARQPLCPGYGNAADFSPQRPGGYFAWVDPAAVSDEDVRLGRNTEVLLIVGAASEYRLMAPSELAPLLDELNVELRDMRPTPPWTPQSLVRRGVCGR